MILSPRACGRGASAVGQRVCVYCTPENPNNWKRVIGVVSSASHAALNEAAKGNVYLAAGAMRDVRRSWWCEQNGPTGDLEKAIRRTIAAIDPNQPVFLSASMTALIADSVADRRFIMMLLAVTAGLALVMSAAGVYGVISYTTSRQNAGNRNPHGGRRDAPRCAGSGVPARLPDGRDRACDWTWGGAAADAFSAQFPARAWNPRNPAHIWIAAGLGRIDRGNRLLDSRAPRDQDRPDVRAAAGVRAGM